MAIAYFDCFSGISGDMTLGALLDAGVSIEDLRSELYKLDLPGYELTALKVMRAGITATKAHVCVDEKDQPARQLADIVHLIQASGLSSSVKKDSISLFQKLASVEANVHGTTTDEVHFHEVGAVDAIVDIVGSVIGLELLGITDAVGSPVNVGSGAIMTAHGMLPVPAPATAELLKGVPSYGSSVPFELTTPTGAVILTAFASSFGPMPHMNIRRIAHGAGSKEIPGRPNVLRLLIGEPAPDGEEDASVVIETNIDDMNPQIYDYLIEKLMAQGALDAYLMPIIMKKGRPAMLLSVLTDKSRSEVMMDTIFSETTSIGVRIQDVRRMKLSREIRKIDTPYGDLKIKISRRNNVVITVTPEYEDCRRLAAEQQVPLKQIMEEAMIAYRSQSLQDE